MQSVLVLVPQDTIYQENRRDTSAGLFFNRTAVQPFPAPALALFRVSYRPPDVDADFTRSNTQQLFQFIQPPLTHAGQPFQLQFRTSYRVPELETEYQRANHQLYFRFISASQPVIYGPAPVLPVGTLLPGDLGTGMGPYKRPGQVFGERDPVSPYLTSRAAAVPPLLSLPSKAPAAVPPPQSLHHHFLTFMLLH
jgi:hypothetical protein